MRSIQEGNTTSPGYTISNVNIGGLVGNKRGTIRNSYALGNVMADRGSGTVGRLHVGGLVGFYGPPMNPQYARGIVTNSVALGASVTAQGSTGTRHAGRISGFPTDDTVIGSGNRAKQSMRVQEGTYSQTWFGNPVNVGAGNAAQRHGATFSDNAFFNASTWSDMGFDNTTLIDHDDNPETPPITRWNFNNVGREGFPRLGWE